MRKNKYKVAMDRRLRRAAAATVEHQVSRNRFYTWNFGKIIAALRKRVNGVVVKLAPGGEHARLAPIGTGGKSKLRDAPKPRRIAYSRGWGASSKRALNNAKREARAAIARAHMVTPTHKAVCKSNKRAGRGRYVSQKYDIALSVGANAYNAAMQRIVDGPNWRSQLSS